MSGSEVFWVGKDGAILKYDLDLKNWTVPFAGEPSEFDAKIHGEWVPVAARIARLDSMSAHADANEILRWLRGFTRPPAQTFIVHGEPPAQTALAGRIAADLGWPSSAPAYRESQILQFQS